MRFLQIINGNRVQVFGVKLSEVDEMIENRFQVGEERRSREGELWPQELWVEG